MVEQVDGLIRQDDASALTINFTSNGQPHAICFPRAVLADLLAALAGMQTPEPGRPIDIPTILAERVEVFRQDGGASGLAFFLAGGWVMPFAIPRAALPGMKGALASLERLNAETAGKP